MKRFKIRESTVYLVRWGVFLVKKQAYSVQWTHQGIRNIHWWFHWLDRPWVTIIELLGLCFMIERERDLQPPREVYPK